ncbi:DNA-processing protein DprA [uncultured Clostridium sp.]|uniref:DNA-processing protein DprA n=1 Tax=uncultured Clostridium sp. TaxID=59620 RepID=UPI0025D4D849|nr:DNA-processing protein DprA [uncultured Clostridium sp.]
MNYDLWFVLLDMEGIFKINLITRYKSAQNIYHNFEYIQENEDYIPEKIKKFNKETLWGEVSRTEEILYKKGIGFITYADSAYSETLKRILDPPYFLFYKGNIDVIKNYCIGVVGARNCSNYGISATKLLTKELITNNITLISGGARGIDSVAHKTALENGGINISVLGCGIDRVYPPENKKLFSQIEEKGVVISEFLLNTPPLKYNFPRRNRIISGLSSGIIVTEAAEGSGSLITARLAKSQGKIVLVVPGSIFYSGAKGSNGFINKDGGIVCSGIDDLKISLGLDHNIQIRPMIKSPEKKRILNCLSDVPMHIDDIFRKTCFERGALYSLLFEMQIKDEIICLPGNYYVKII